MFLSENFSNTFDMQYMITIKQNKTFASLRKILWGNLQKILGIVDENFDNLVRKHLRLFGEQCNLMKT